MMSLAHILVWQEVSTAIWQLDRVYRMECQSSALFSLRQKADLEFLSYRVLCDFTRVLRVK